MGKNGWGWVWGNPRPRRCMGLLPWPLRKNWGRSYILVHWTMPRLAIWSINSAIILMFCYLAKKEPPMKSANPSPSLPGPIILLVEPQLVENIGMTARAMMNTGLSELRLVNPRDPWPLGEVHQQRMMSASSGADEILQNAKIFAT